MVSFKTLSRSTPTGIPAVGEKTGKWLAALGVAVALVWGATLIAQNVHDWSWLVWALNAVGDAYSNDF